MELTEEQIKQNNHISTSEIEQDIYITQNEIDQYEKELEILEHNRLENKTNIYMLEGKISSRIEFIKKLQSILNYRNNG